MARRKIVPDPDAGLTLAERRDPFFAELMRRTRDLEAAGLSRWEAMRRAEAGIVAAHLSVRLPWRIRARRVGLVGPMASATTKEES